MSNVLQDSNHQDLAYSASLRFGPAPGSACAFKRMATAATNEQKVFILHDDGENSTAARLRTVDLARLFDSSEIVTYYRNAIHKLHSVPGDKSESLRVSWSGKDQADLVKSSNFIRYTVSRKGAFAAMIGLGQARRVLELVAKEHNLKESSPDPNRLPNSGRYPITVLTPTLFTTFYVAEPEPFSNDVVAPFPSTILPNQALLAYAKDSITNARRLYGEPKPGLEELKAAKAAKKQEQFAALRQMEEDKRIWLELKRRHDAGEDVILPDPPLSGRQKRRREKLEAQMTEIWGDTNSPNEEYPENYFDVIPSVIQRLEASVEESDKVSNYILAPTAEPVIPCSVNLLGQMIHWLELDVDIVAQQEPRIDFVRGSILGKTSSMAGGTSVDLCKQVVGPKGIGPILEAVGKNSHIDRFLLGNNIVGDEGAKIIADFIDSPKSKRIYNFYIAGNAIGPEGIRKIANALVTNTTVTALWLKRNPLLPQGSKYLASMMSINTKLQTLDLVNTGIRDEGVIALMEALQSNPGSALKHLYLGSNAETAISGRAIGQYLQSGRSRLTSLVAGSSRLGNEGVMAISEGLKVDRLLERLGLESARVGDGGAKALADALSDHPSMIMLDLGFRKGTYELGEKANSITDDGLLYLGDRLFGPEARRRNQIRAFDAVNNQVTHKGARTFVDKYVLDNEQLLSIRLSQTGEKRNVEVEHITRRLTKERKTKYFDPERKVTPEERAERDRVSEALDPIHIAEIYSIYRGNM